MREKNKKEDLNEALTSYMNSLFESVKTLKRIYYFFNILLISYFFLQVYYIQTVLDNFGLLGLLPLLVLVLFIFLNYTKVKEIALSNSNLGYNLFKLKFGDEYDQWLKHNEEAGNKTLSEVIAHCNNRKKDLADYLGNSEIRYLCFRNREGYHENVSQYTDIIAIVNSTYTYSGYEIHKASNWYFLDEKKIRERRKNSKFPF